MTQPVIITGMHRSGTSLTASIMQRAGINIGAHLIGPDKGNLLGHFEDVDFNNFHAKVLERFGQSYLVQDLGTLGQLTPDEVAEAESLVEQRRQIDLWGWKDPRTTLFLDFWHNLLPNARYIFLYRHPLEVVTSILRRGKHFDEEALADPLVALYSWQAHNQAILEFYQQHQEISVLASIDAVVADIDRFIRLTADKLNLPLTSSDASLRFQATEFSQTCVPEQTMQSVTYIAPGVVSVLNQLHSCADLPYSSPQLPDLPDERISQLEQLLDGLDDHEMLEREQRSHTFSLLLAYTAPNAIVASREVLEQIHTAQIERLTTQVKQLENKQLALQHQNQEKSNRIEELQQWLSRLEQLQQQVTEQTDLISEQTSFISNQTRLIDEIKSDLAKKSNYTQHLQQQVVHQKNQVSQLHQKLSKYVDDAQILAERLQAMENTRVWRLARRWYAFKEKLVGQPAGRAATITMNSTPIQSQPAKKSIANTPLRSNIDQPAVLFISHYAGRTGAPILLLNFIKWFKANTDIPFEILLKKGGELQSEFEALGPTKIWYIASSSESNTEQIIDYYQRANIGLIYANTITNGGILAKLAGLDCPVITHVHELAFWINEKVNPQDLNYTKKYTTHYIAVSNAVKANLISHLEIPSKSISLIYEFVPSNPSIDVKNAVDRIQTELKIPPGTFIVGGCGTTDWRKGPDLFIQLAQIIHQRRPDASIHFVWVGGENNGQQYAPLLHDIRQAGLEHLIHFVGTVSNPLDYFATFDVFALVSREDPFPVVNLEVASLGKPIICFANSGGASEFVQQDAGFVAPYLNLERMADQVLHLLSQPELKHRLGRKAAQKVRESHTIEGQGTKIAALIQEQMQSEDTPCRSTKKYWGSP